MKKFTADASKAVTKMLTVRMLDKQQAVLGFHRNFMCANISLAGIHAAEDVKNKPLLIQRHPAQVFSSGQQQIQQGN